MSKWVFACVLSSPLKGCAGHRFDGALGIPVTPKALSITAHYPGRERKRGDPWPRSPGLTEGPAGLNINRATKTYQLGRCQHHEHCSGDDSATNYADGKVIREAIHSTAPWNTLKTRLIW